MRTSVHPVISFFAILLLSAVSGAEQDKYQLLVSAVEEGKHGELAEILLDPLVDPSFNDHQLIRESEVHFGAKTLRHLLLDYRFNPSAHENMLLKKAFESGNIFVTMMLLAHPKVDPRYLGDNFELSEDNDSELQEMMHSLKGRHLAVREGRGSDPHPPMTIHAYVTLLFTSLLNGREDHARKLISVSGHIRISFPFDLALCLDHPVIGRLAVEMNQKFKSRMTRFPFLDEFIGRLRSWKAIKSLDFIMEHIVAKDAALGNLIQQLLDPENSEKNKAADKLILYALNTFSAEDVRNIREYLVHLASTSLFKHYVALPQGLLPELIDYISDTCL